MNKEERIDRIERYLRGEMNEQDQLTLEQELSRDPGLQKELQLHREVHHAIGDPALQQFTRLLKEREAAYFSEAQPAKVAFLRRYRVPAAAISLLILGGLIYWFVQRPADPQELFATYFEAYRAPGAFRGEDITDLEDNFLLGVARYDEGRFAEAADYFSRALAKDPQKDIAVFLRGVSYLAIDSLPAAERDLRAISADEESLFREPGQWYLGLLYLRRRDTQRARPYFENLGSSGQARELLEQL